MDLGGAEKIRKHHFNHGLLLLLTGKYCDQYEDRFEEY